MCAHVAAHAHGVVGLQLEGGGGDGRHEAFAVISQRRAVPQDHVPVLAVREVTLAQVRTAMQTSFLGSASFSYSLAVHWGFDALKCQEFLTEQEDRYLSISLRSDSHHNAIIIQISDSARVARDDNASYQQRTSITFYLQVFYVTDPLMIRLSSNRYTFMCCTPIVSLNFSGSSHLRQPLSSGVWYRATRVRSPKFWINGSSKVLEFFFPEIQKDAMTIAVFFLSFTPTSFCHPAFLKCKTGGMISKSS